MSDSPKQSRVPKSERVLVVDGYETDLRAVDWLLRDNGYDVASAGSVATARQLSALFDAAIVEVELSDGSGVELVGVLLASGRVRRAIFYTECLSHELLRDARRVAPVVSKDEGPEALISVLRSASLPESHFPAPSLEAHDADNFKKMARGTGNG